MCTDPATLPSTVSSSVVMVSMAKGNISGAIFNASISGLIGVVVTPIWMSLFLNSENGGINFWESFLSLVIRILLPVAIGLFLHRFFGEIVSKYSKTLAKFDKTVILAIVYKSFSESFEAKLFDTIELSDLLMLFVAVLLLFSLVYFLIGRMADALKFNREDKITALFSGSKKSLVHGTVMSKVLFENMASQGLFLIPIMIYHSLQLIIISFIAQKIGKEVEE